MPIYTYACTACGAQIERRQSFSDAPLTTCESCSGALRRVMHPVGVIFKGSGFYNTDYKNKSAGGLDGAAKGDEKKPAETAAKTESGGTTGGDSGSSTTPSSPSTTSSSGSTTPAAANA